MENVITNQAALATKRLMDSGSNNLIRGHEKAVEAVSWVYRWGYSTTRIIDSLAGIKRKGLCARLVKRGMLVKTISECGRYELITLTPEDGLGLATRSLDRLIPSPYAKDPHRISVLRVRHNMIVQRVVKDMLTKNLITDYISEHENRTGSESGIKQPDAFGLNGDQKKYAIEIELSPKFERDLDQFVERTLRMLAANNGLEMLLYTDSPAIIRRYKQAFNSGEFSVWEKINQRWKTTCTKRYDTTKFADRILYLILPKSLLPF